jgi:hypothetical protein
MQPQNTAPAAVQQAHPALIKVLADKFEYLTVTDLDPTEPAPFVHADPDDLTVLGISEGQYRGTAVEIASFLGGEPCDASLLLDAIAWTIAAMTETTAR